MKFEQQSGIIPIHPFFLGGGINRRCPVILSVLSTCSCSVIPAGAPVRDKTQCGHLCPDLASAWLGALGGPRARRIWDNFSDFTNIIWGSSWIRLPKQFGLDEGIKYFGPRIRILRQKLFIQSYFQV